MMRRWAGSSTLPMRRRGCIRTTSMRRWSYSLARRCAGRMPRRSPSGWPMLPAGECIRAKAIGASEYSVQLSGNTIYISSPGELLPRKNLQVLQPPFVCGEAIVPAELARSIRDHFSHFDLVEGEADVALAFHWRGVPSYERIARFAQGVIQVLPRTVAAEKPLFLVFDGDIAQTLGGDTSGGDGSGERAAPDRWGRSQGSGVHRPRLHPHALADRAGDGEVAGVHRRPAPPGESASARRAPA